MTPRPWSPLFLVLLASHALGQAPSGPEPSQPPKASARILTLEEALALGRKNQPQLRQAQANTVAAAARADEAQSGLLPQLSASAFYERTTVNTSAQSLLASGKSVSITTRNLGYWSVAATLSQLIYDFGQVSGRWRASQAASASQRETETSTAIQTDLGVKIAFFAARAARDMVGVARDNLSDQQAHVAQTKAFVDHGTHPEIDLAVARTNEANAQAQLIASENSYFTAKAQLNQAMGDEEPTDYEIADESPVSVEGEDLVLEPLLNEALNHRPDLASLLDQARSQRLTLDSIRGAYAPTLGLTANYTDAGVQTFSPILVPNGYVGLNLTWNLFQGGLTNAQVREAEANFVAAQAAVDTVRLQVRVDVEQARLAVRAAKGVLEANLLALASAKEQLRLADRRYATGIGNAIELADSQLAYTTAAAQVVQANYNLSTSRAQLVRALGRENIHA